MRFAIIGTEECKHRMLDIVFGRDTCRKKSVQCSRKLFSNEGGSIDAITQSYEDRREKSMARMG